ncbi:MAG: SIMPL domain-containing protein [Muribaculaceae bacterium]|nr:SIMPL domain-containing protein [Muribaculaceae bacterium]
MSAKSIYIRFAGTAIIGAAIFCLGLFIKSGIDNIAYRDRNVTVRGLAERQVEADFVTWPITYNVAGDDLMSLYDQVTRYNEVIVNFLTSNGIDKSEIAVNPPDTYNATANQYGSSNFRYKYALNCNITVATTKVDKVRQLLDRQTELLKEGVPYSNSYINYEFRALNDIKPDMIAEATRNAREAAQQFAKDSDSKVGKMKTATQGQFSIEDTSSSTPYTKNIRVVSTIVFYLED